MKKLTKISALLLMTGLLTTGCGNTPSGSNSKSETQSSSVSISLEHKISYVENENCSISLSKELAKRDEKIEITISNITEGYEVHKVTANGYIVDNYSFIMPNEDVEVEVFLKQRITTNNNETIKYSVKTVANEYAVIKTQEYYYAPGDLVIIDYSCKGSYVLDKFLVNNEEIEGTSFIMPEDNVLISGTFIDVLPYTPWQLSCSAAGITANSYWYFNYGAEGLEITVKVKDNRLCGKEFVLPNNAGNPVAWSDNVEIILGPKNTNKGYVTNETFKVIVDFLGNSQVSYANSSSGWAGTKSYASLVFNASSNIKSLENKDGYNGYEVKIFASYSMFNLNRNSALNNITTCLAMRNSNTYGGSGSSWNCFNSDINIWQNCANQPIILENNGLQNR